LAQRLKVLTKLLEIVNLSVEHQAYTRLLVNHGLVPALNVDDAETAKTKAHAFFEMESKVVRTAMRK
jgi:hypothetical protein